MKIKRKDRRKFNFNELAFGETFIFNDSVYLKIDIEHKAARLGSGSVYEFPGNPKIEKIELEANEN